MCELLLRYTVRCYIILYMSDYTVKYKSNLNVVYSCKYHVIWCPKYRRPVLVKGVDVRLKEIIQAVATDCRTEIFELEVMPDHVHLLVEVDPQFGKHLVQLANLGLAFQRGGLHPNAVEKNDAQKPSPALSASVGPYSKKQKEAIILETVYEIPESAESKLDELFSIMEG